MSDPIAALIGIILGAACSIPTSLLLVALLRARQARRQPMTITTYRPALPPAQGVAAIPQLEATHDPQP